MGNQFMRIIPFIHTDENSDTVESRRSVSPAFDVGDALEDVPPDVYLRRNTAVRPSILISGKQFLALQEHIPPRFQSRRWRLLYCSSLHGFSRLALQHNCSNEVKNSRRKDRPAILMISAGSQGRILVGAYLSCIPQASQRRYIGTEETFVFCAPPASQLSTCVSVESLPSLSASDGGVRLFAAPENGENRYFVRCDGGAIAVGGGGGGPAILLHADFTTVTCSAACPTFGLHESLLLLGAAACGESCGAADGVRVEDGEASAAVHAIQLWTIGDDHFMCS